jgi:ATP/maltotriose-dependent transcriptional regulator MalT/DNA-binding SARP family transcriptional activator
MLTKLTPPKLMRNVLIRQRLFKRLDTAEHEAAIWLAGPAGSGKTSLMVSYLKEKRIPAIWYQIDPGDSDPANFFYYLNQAVTPLLSPPTPPLPLLTPEYAISLETFIAGYVEMLFRRLKPPRWIVLDNFQEISNDAALIQHMAGVIARTPADFKLVLISRHDPPPGMARLRANRVLKTIGGAALTLSLAECRQLNEVLGCDWSERATAEVHRLTRGWMAGLILLSLDAAVDPGSPTPSAGIESSGLFDYFAVEVFKKCDPQTQQFLTQTAVLPQMTAAAAQRLTRMDAEAMIAHLRRRNFFLEQRQLDPPSYQYHPLFRDFLMQMASRTLGQDALKDVMNRGAAILAECGLGSEAVTLFQQAGNVPAMAAFILSQAKSLVAQGRTGTLDRWIDAVPADRLRQHPWLLFWKGVCRMHSQPAAAKAHFIQAYASFESTDDLWGRVFSWSALIQVFLIMRDSLADLDRWIDEGQRLEAMIPADADPDVSGRFAGSLLLALSLRNLGHPDFFRVQALCENLLQRCADKQVLDTLGSLLGMSYLWMGQMHRMGVLLKHAKPMMTHPDAPPVTRVNFLTVSSIFNVMSGDWAKARRTIAQALDLSEQTGVHGYDFVVLAYGAYIGLLTGDRRLVAEYVDRLERLLSPRSMWDTGQYHYIQAGAALLNQNFPQARFHLDEALKIAEYSGTPHPIGLSLILRATTAIVELGDFTKAVETVDRISHVKVAQDTGQVFFLRELLLADCALADQRRTDMVAHLKAAFADAAKNGLMMPLGLSRERLAGLLSEAIRADIETELVTALVQRLQLTPAPDHLVGQAWPWPIKLITLGRFAMVVDDRRLAVSKKTPKKPLELLTVLICQKGRPIDRESVMDQLWPDADGDRAVQNLNTTLHRLRKLLCKDEAVTLENGRLALNQRLCWVDAWHFEAMVEKARSDPSAQNRIDWLSRSIDLYQGAFYGSRGDVEKGIWYAHRLKSLWVDAMLTLSRLYIEKKQVDRSKDLLQQALAVDDSIEPIYQELIGLLHDQGRFSEAQLVLNRCRRVMSDLGLVPTEATRSLFKQRQGQRPAVKTKTKKAP